MNDGGAEGVDETSGLGGCGYSSGIPAPGKFGYRIRRGHIVFGERRERAGGSLAILGFARVGKGLDVIFEGFADAIALAVFNAYHI